RDDDVHVDDRDHEDLAEGDPQPQPADADPLEQRKAAVAERERQGAGEDEVEREQPDVPPRRPHPQRGDGQGSDQARRRGQPGRAAGVGPHPASNASPRAGEEEVPRYPAGGRARTPARCSPARPRLSFRAERSPAWRSGPTTTFGSRLCPRPRPTWARRPRSLLVPPRDDTTGPAF